MLQYRNTDFAVEVLDLVKRNMFQVVEYANSLYNEFKAVIVETLISEIGNLKTTSPPTNPQKFFAEVELIQRMCNRVISKKATLKLT